MQFNLSGKAALITGATGGLGARMAHILAQHGAKVILTGRTSNTLQHLSQNIPNSMVYTMDVSNKHSVKTTFEQLEQDNIHIEICINNAALAKRTPIFEESDHQAFENMLQTNVMGVWYVTHAVANHMKKHAIKGSIINISSVNGGNRLRESLTGYATSKAAVNQMTKALVGELSKAGIRINSIAPGLM